MNRGPESEPNNPLLPNKITRRGALMIGVGTVGIAINELLYRLDIKLGRIPKPQPSGRAADPNPGRQMLRLALFGTSVVGGVTYAKGLIDHFVSSKLADQVKDPSTQSDKPEYSVEKTELEQVISDKLSEIEFTEGQLGDSRAANFDLDPNLVSLDAKSLNAWCSSPLGFSIETVCPDSLVVRLSETKERGRVPAQRRMELILPFRKSYPVIRHSVVILLREGDSQIHQNIAYFTGRPLDYHPIKDRSLELLHKQRAHLDEPLYKLTGLKPEAYVPLTKLVEILEGPLPSN